MHTHISVRWVIKFLNSWQQNQLNLAKSITEMNKSKLFFYIEEIDISDRHTVEDGHKIIKN